MKATKKSPASHKASRAKLAQGQEGDNGNEAPESVWRISGGLFDRAVGCAQISPIDIGAQVFTADSADAFSLDIDCQTFSATFSVSDVSQVPRGGSAFAGELFSLSNRQAHEEGFECAHAANNNRTVNVLQ